MSKYRVVMTRSTTESCVVIVDGDNEDEADDNAFQKCKEPNVEWDTEGSIPDDPMSENIDKIEVDDEDNCIYCGNKCYNGEMCDEQQAGGFNRG